MLPEKINLGQQSTQRLGILKLRRSFGLGLEVIRGREEKTRHCGPCRDRGDNRRGKPKSREIVLTKDWRQLREMESSLCYNEAD